MSDGRSRPIARWKDNPYAADLGDMDTMRALADTPERLRAVNRQTKARCAGFDAGSW